MTPVIASAKQKCYHRVIGWMSNYINVYEQLHQSMSLLRISWSVSKVSLITCHDFDWPCPALWFRCFLRYHMYVPYKVMYVPYKVIYVWYKVMYVRYKVMYVRYKVMFREFYVIQDFVYQMAFGSAQSSSWSNHIFIFPSFSVFLTQICLIK